MSRETSRRERKRLESRDQLIDCAAKLFATQGYAETTVEEIGNCADVSRATVFNYFPRKEDLVLAWFDSRRTRIALILAEAATPQDISTRLSNAFRTLARIFTEDPRVGRGMVRAWLQAGGPLLSPDSETTRLFADAIRVGQADGHISPETDPDLAGVVLFDAYLGVLYRWVTADRSPPNIEESLLAVLDLVLRGIATPRAPQ